MKIGIVLLNLLYYNYPNYANVIIYDIKFAIFENI